MYYKKKVDLIRVGKILLFIIHTFLTFFSLIFLNLIFFPKKIMTYFFLSYNHNYSVDNKKIVKILLIILNFFAKNLFFNSLTLMFSYTLLK